MWLPLLGFVKKRTVGSPTKICHELPDGQFCQYQVVVQKAQSSRLDVCPTTSRLGIAQGHGTLSNFHTKVSVTKFAVLIILLAASQIF